MLRFLQSLLLLFLVASVPFASRGVEFEQTIVQANPNRESISTNGTNQLEAPAVGEKSGEELIITRRQWNHESSRVLFGSDFLLRSNETSRGLVIIGGNAEIQGQVNGELVVIGGRATISGTVDRDMVVVLGSAEVRSNATLNGEAVLIGGPFSISSEANLAREKVEVALGNVMPRVEWFKRWIFECLILGRLLSYELAWPWTVAAGFLVVYFFALVLFPGAVKSTVKTIETRPVASICSGLLALIVAAPITFLLVLTVVGIFVIPFLKLAYMLAAVFGKVALICYLGRNILRSFRLGPENAFFSFAGGAILLTLIYTVPVVGLLAYAVGSVFGLGAAIVALFASFKREESSVPTNFPAANPSSFTPPSTTEGPQTAVPPQIPNFHSVTALQPGDTVLLPRAGFWRRVAAALLDLVLIGVIFFFLGRWFPLIAVLYFTAMWRWKGTTIGGILLRLKVVRTDGRPLNLAVALVRALSTCFSIVVLLLGFIWIAWDREKQAWHDKIAGTIVVRMPRDFSLL